MVNRIADGYETDLDQFKKGFSLRVKRIAGARVSHNAPLVDRRLDSLARLFECNSICAAVYYHPPQQAIFVANNLIHKTSREKNQQIEQIETVCDLLCDESLRIETILERLTHIILSNFQSGQRQAPSDSDSISLSNWLKDAVKSPTLAVWQEKCRTGLKGKQAQLARTMTRLVRDFFKVRDFLYCAQDSYSQDLQQAIRNREFSIVSDEQQKVHAEIRIMSHVGELGIDESTPRYIGISKLCCAHCAVTLKKFGFLSRGIHGKGFDWPIASSVVDQLETFLGKSLYERYEGLSQADQEAALQFIESKESIINKKRPSMLADDSDSDVELGVQIDDPEMDAQLKDLEHEELSILHKVMDRHKQKVLRIFEYTKDLREIVAMSDLDEEAFLTLGTRRLKELIDALFESEGLTKEKGFEFFRELFEDRPKLFWQIFRDKSNAIIEYGIDALLSQLKIERTYKKAVAVLRI